eukprot:SAG31_NODE_1173_length_9543_cov_8.654913_3_plen_62_part_00
MHTMIRMPHAAWRAARNRIQPSASPPAGRLAPRAARAACGHPEWVTVRVSRAESSAEKPSA